MHAVALVTLLLTAPFALGGPASEDGAVVERPSGVDDGCPHDAVERLSEALAAAARRVVAQPARAAAGSPHGERIDPSNAIAAVATALEASRALADGSPLRHDVEPLLASALARLEAAVQVDAGTGSEAMQAAFDHASRSVAEAARAVPQPAVPDGGSLDKGLVRDALFAAPIVVWTNQNMGPGSCLDADTLDGYQAGHFLTLIADETHAREAGDAALATRTEALEAHVAGGAFLGTSLEIHGDATVHGDLRLTGTLTEGTVPWARLQGAPRIVAGTGLAGGGALDAERILALDAVGLTGCASPAMKVTWDPDAGRLGCGPDQDTTYAAGFGLALSGSTLSANTQVVQARVTGTCPAGQSIRVVSSTGSVTCQIDENSGGTVTQVATGAGLVGGPITGSGTVSIATGGVTGSMVKDGTIATVDLANGAVTGAKTDATTVQARVSGSCAPGSAVRAVAQNGQVTCGVPGRPGHAVTSHGPGGWDAAITIGADGLGLIAHRNPAGFGLSVSHCNDVACTSATTVNLDPGGAAEDLSVTIGADGLGLISYQDTVNLDLKVAHCTTVTCSTADLAIIDSVGDVGQFSSVTIGADGLGLISYYDATNGDLKVAHCDDTACASATTSVIDGSGDKGWFTSITVGRDGLGLISYRELSGGTANNLKVAHCRNLLCSSATTALIDVPGDVGWHTSIAIGVDGLGLVSYREGGLNTTLKVAHCDDLVCSSATKTTIDAPGNVGFSTSVAVGSDGLGIISYASHENGEFDLKVAHCNDLVCSSATNHTLDEQGNVGAFTSITVGTDGLPLIAYYSVAEGLKVVHLANVGGVPYHRAR